MFGHVPIVVVEDKAVVVVLTEVAIGKVIPPLQLQHQRLGHAGF